MEDESLSIFVGPEFAPKFNSLIYILIFACTFYNYLSQVGSINSPDVDPCFLANHWTGFTASRQPGGFLSQASGFGGLAASKLQKLLL